ncbi:hypothetical protein EVAR_79288_1 [Eumeta japonica]|uniref:Uncharacterized protein n=1 Tax=Eumeta variegata TaxID=151549 RepID=A0A4C1TEQ0_EUMVA|nr:hypothetical protein EVAR_79288_1 [Eumeta japonica]
MFKRRGDAGASQFRFAHREMSGRDGNSKFGTTAPSFNIGHGPRTKLRGPRAAASSYPVYLSSALRNKSGRNRRRPPGTQIWGGRLYKDART